jgi:hypothetical protein
MKKMYALLSALLITSSALHATCPCPRFLKRFLASQSLRPLRQMLPDSCTTECRECDAAIEILQNLVSMDNTTAAQRAEQVRLAGDFIRLPGAFKNGNIKEGIANEDVRKYGAQCLQTAILKEDYNVVALLVLSMRISPLSRAEDGRNAFAVLDTPGLDPFFKRDVEQQILRQAADRSTPSAFTIDHPRAVRLDQTNYSINPVTGKIIKDDEDTALLGNPEPEEASAVEAQALALEWGGENNEPTNVAQQEEPVQPAPALRRSTRTAAAAAKARIAKQASRQ